MDSNITNDPPTVGEILKNKRQSLGLTLDELALRLSIRKPTLLIIESGSFSELPSYIHAVSFVKNYSKVLGIDFETELESLFNEECKKTDFDSVLYSKNVVLDQSTKETKNSVPTANKSKPTPIVILLVAFIVILVTVGIFYKQSQNKVTSTQANQLIPEEISILIDPNTEAIALPEPSFESSPHEHTVVALETTQASPVAVVTFDGNCWMSVSIDSGTPVEFTGKKGDSYTINFTNNFNINFGNSSVVTVQYQDKVFKNFGPLNVPTRNNYFELNGEKELVYTKRR